MHADHIAQLLPETFRVANRDGSVLNSLLSVMEGMHARSEQALGDLDGHLDPMRAPRDFVLMLSAWLGYDRYLDWSGGRTGVGTPRFASSLSCLRSLLAAAPELTRTRGTREALERFLTIATGLQGFQVDENPPGANGKPIPFHIVVTAPPSARRMRRLVKQIVEDARPAYVTCTLVIPEDEQAGATAPSPPTTKEGKNAQL